ncbi:sodium-dependent phosphate transport protein 2A-like, partial [Artemia franciscana]|uniref:sodium-dependent phosphate transport protein 2A-like n=1 Tax=Artemia franciscana TaxID=6661 RepID=UPI0032DA1FFC
SHNKLLNYLIIPPPQKNNFTFFSFSELDCKGKFIRVTINLLKFLSALACLYLFVVSLDLLQAAFKLLGGKSAGSIFSSESLLGNPVVGVMLGILTTVLVQSSSTSTSIVVSMVAAGILTVQVAIPIIMGSNIGTSVTNTIVSFTQISNKNEFRRAFAGATVHDMFNWLTVIVLFTVEMTTRGIFGIGYLEFVSGEITSGLSESSGAGGEIEILKVITGPAVDLIVQLNKTVLDKWALGEWQDVNSLLKTCGPKNNTYKCTISDYLFADTGMSDAAVGSILLVISLVILCICLVVLVKILNSILKGMYLNF